MGFTIAIDKLDKIGMEGVERELIERGVTPEACTKLRPILALSGSNEEKMAQLHTLLAGSAEGEKGLAELSYIFEMPQLVHEQGVKLDITLARGLNYYTGAIFEVKALDVEIGSITGGGRYDDLTGIFGVSGMSGVGISFGADRIFDVLSALNLLRYRVARN